MITPKGGYMRIYNTYGKGSTEAAVTFIIATGIVVILFTWFFYDAIVFGGDNTLNDFWQWYCNAYKFLDSSSEITLVYSPPILWLAATSRIVASLKAKTKKFNKKPNLKYIDFFPDKVKFCFNRPQYDFACAYDNIENFEMDIETGLTYLPRKYVITPMVDVKQLYLSLTVPNNRIFSLITNQRSMNTMYSIIDIGRSVKNFSYKFSGLGEIEHTKEQIEKYQKYRVKSFLTNNMKDGFVIISFMLLIFSLFGFKMEYGLYDIFSSFGFGMQAYGVSNKIDPMLYIAIILLLGSFVFDIILIKDNIKNKKLSEYKNSYGSNNNENEKSILTDKLSPQKLLIAKIVICIIFFLFFC